MVSGNWRAAPDEIVWPNEIVSATFQGGARWVQLELGYRLASKLDKASELKEYCRSWDLIVTQTGLYNIDLCRLKPLQPWIPRLNKVDGTLFTRTPLVIQD